MAITNFPHPPFFVSKNLQITYKEPASQNESRIALGQAFLSVRLVQQYTRTATATPSATGFELESRGLRQCSNLNVLFGHVG